MEYNEQNEIVEKIINMLPQVPRSYDTSDDPGFWTDGTEILCPSEMECEIIANFLRDILNEFGTMDINTGFYDPYEDAKNGEQDDRTGFYYIDFN